MIRVKIWTKTSLKKAKRKANFMCTENILDFGTTNFSCLYNFRK